MEELSDIRGFGCLRACGESTLSRSARTPSSPVRSICGVLRQAIPLGGRQTDDFTVFVGLCLPRGRFLSDRFPVPGCPRFGLYFCFCLRLWRGYLIGRPRDFLRLVRPVAIVALVIIGRRSLLVIRSLGSNIRIAVVGFIFGSGSRS